MMARPEITWDDEWKVWEIELPGGGKFGSGDKQDCEVLLDDIERMNRPIGPAYKTVPTRRWVFDGKT